MPSERKIEEEMKICLPRPAFFCTGRGGFNNYVRQKSGYRCEPLCCRVV